MNASAENDRNLQTGGGSGGYIGLVFWIIAAVVAAVLSWRANSYELMGMRVIYTIGACISGPTYLIYYAIIRALFGYEYAFLRKIPV